MKSFVFRNRYWLYVLLTIPVIIMMFWKCKWGYATLDEAFYPTIAYRFLQGDCILYDEWNNTQLSSIVIMPFLKVYMLICGGTDGVYLFLRYTYTALKVLISIFCLSDDYNIPNIMLTVYFAYYKENMVFREISFKPRQGGVNSINIPKIIKIGWKAIGGFMRFKKGL